VTTSQERVLKEITQRLVSEFQPERIILFGSQAWGQPTADSDLDLLVIVPDSKLSPARRAQRAQRCLGNLPTPTDILVKTHAEVERLRQVYTSLVAQALERGIVLYG
jgi:predicted nucleotidyltransferase